MPLQGWITLGVLIATVLALARELLPPPATILSAVILLMVIGVLSPSEAFGGFSNPAPIAVAALYVLARAVERTGALQPIVGATLGDGVGRMRPLLRLVLPTASASAFLNNTPIVAMLAPQVSDWATRRGQSPSRYLMPLSFAAILGGVVTTIGTSTNLVVSGLLEASGDAPLGMFEITTVGLPAALAGIAAVVLFAPLLLPDRRGTRRELDEDFREFVVHMLVKESGAFDAKTVEEAGLRHLQGVFLVEIERGSELITPVTPTTRLHGGDRLTFVGKADLIVDLQGMRGLVSAEHQHTGRLDQSRHAFFEAVVGEVSPLVGRTMREASFRERYQAAVVAIHRAGKRVKAKLGEVRLRVGDTLLIMGDPGFLARFRDRNDFLLVSRLDGAPPVTTKRAWVVGAVTVAIVVGSALGILPILHLSLLGAIVLVLSGVLDPWEARQSVDLNVIVVIAGAFGLGAAMDRSGLAPFLAGEITDLFGSLGPAGVLFGLLLATVLLTSIITNNAAAVLMFPIAVSASGATGLSTRSVAIAIAVASSVSFLTPIAYQTNLMVYGPGGYRFSDYVRLGGVVTLVVVPAILLSARML
jgi:di/tricarboxylate transporter